MFVGLVGTKEMEISPFWNFLFKGDVTIALGFGYIPNSLVKGTFVLVVYVWLVRRMD